MDTDFDHHHRVGGHLDALYTEASIACLIRGTSKLRWQAHLIRWLRAPGHVSGQLPSCLEMRHEA